MAGCENWFCGRAPLTDMERRQAEAEAMYAREEEAERRARFDEAPVPKSELLPPEEFCEE